MKLEYHKFADMLTANHNNESFRFGYRDQRQLLTWFAREKPEMVREAMGVDKILKNLEKQRMKAEQDYRAETDPSERQYLKSRNNTLCSVIKYLEKTL